MTVCKFYARGCCTFGALCRNEHPQNDAYSTNRDISAGGTDFIPRSIREDVVALPACRFFASGRCNRGNSCKFSHEQNAHQWTARNALTASESNINHIEGTSSEFTKFTAPSIGPNGSLSASTAGSQHGAHIKPLKRRLRGSIVIYKEGAEVDTVSVAPEDKSGGELVAARQSVRAPYLVCTWYKASKMMYLHYARGDHASDAATALDRQTIHGRRMRAWYDPPDNIAKGATLTVTLTDLNPATSGLDVLEILSPDIWPSKIFLGKRSHDLDDEEASRAVRSRFEAIGRIDEWKSIKREDAKSKAMVKFRDPGDVHEAQRKLNGALLRELNSTKLFVNLVVSIRYTLRGPVYEILKPKLEEFAEHVWGADKVRLSSYDGEAGQLQHHTKLIRLQGERPDAVARARAGLEPLLDGHTAVSGEKPIWHNFFASAQGLALIINTWRRHGGFISVMAQQHKLTLHGSKEQVLNLESILDKQQQELLAQDRQIQEAPCNRAQSKLSRIGEDASQCPICFEGMDNPVSLACGHAYCKECFQQQCAVAPDVGLPLRCQGGKDGTCQEIVVNTALETILPHDAFEELLEGSLEPYVRSRPTELQYCPTPDCPNIYHVTASEGWVAVCEACLEPICTTCGVIAHVGLTCSEYRDLTSEGTKAFNKWKKENGVKDCPKCATPIEKSEGCNHMTCGACGTHICWFCMASFDSAGQTYLHMEAVHRNFYDHDVRDGAAGD